ncbi:hypothetical protein GY45DRAFT_1439106 [Cubamyces sp. BRFM 1775]|nr:hypothetical protein GY45DRAFT_1439106 [Cubamyces sp. BRFM 1775]
MVFNIPSTSRVLLPDPVIVIAAAVQGPLVHPSPRSRSISTHIQDLRSVAATSQLLRGVLRDTELCIARMTIRNQEDFVYEWMGIVKRYEQMLDQADRAASQVAAVLEVLYLIREKRSATPGDIIQELDALHPKLEPRAYELKPVCAALRNDVEEFYLRIRGAIHGNSTAAREDTDKTYVNPDVRREGLKPTNTPSASTKSSSRRTAARHHVSRLCTILARILGFPLPLLCAVRMSEESEEEYYGPRATAWSATTGHQDLPPVDKDPPGAYMPNDASRMRCESPQEVPASHEQLQETESLILLESLKEILGGLDKQTHKLDAFPQLAEHLQNDIEAYVTALTHLGKNGHTRTLTETQHHVDVLSDFSDELATVSESEVLDLECAFAIIEQ